MSVKKKVKVSRNRKKAWRKHTDIKEIEDYLDDKRLEERLGVSVADAPDEELFMIEKTGDNKEYQKKLEDFQNNPKLTIDVSESKLRQLSTNFKLYGKLESTSNVPAVRSKDPNKEKRKTVYNDGTKLEKFWNDRKDFVINGRKQKEARKRVYDDPKKKFQVFDLWREEDKPAEEDYLVNPQPPLKVPVHLLQKPSLLPAVEVPLAAQSYNPDQKEHNELFVEATKKEIEKINEEKRWAHKVERFYVSKEEAPNERTWLTEMSQGLGLYEHENEPAEEESPLNDEEVAKFTKLIKSEKKTKQQRRKELKEKLVKKKKAEEKNLRIKENEIFRLKTFKKELDERDRKINRRAEIRTQRHIESLYKPKRLSRYRFDEGDVPLNLPSEVTGSLRTVKVEGSLLDDRFKSLQKRNIIETRVRQSVKKRKFKLKKEIKKRHRPST